VTVKRTQPHTDYSSCVICQRGSEAGTLHRLTTTGYSTLLYAVENRDDDVSFRLAHEMVPASDFLAKQPLLHSSCRGSYTNRKTVEQKRRRSVSREHLEGKSTCTDDKDELSGAVPKTRAVSTSRTDFKTECFICERARSRKGDRKLLLVSSNDRQNAVWQAAKELKDSAMLHKIQGFGTQCTDMVANDFRYHRECMTWYVARRKPDNPQGPSATSTDAFDAALRNLVSQIDGPMLQDGSVFFVTTLRKRYRECLAAHGVENASSYRSQALIGRLRKYYTTDQGCRIMVVPQKGTSSLICSSAISIGNLMKQVTKLKQDLDEADYEHGGDESDEDPDGTGTIDITRMSYHAAKSLRTEVKERMKAERESLKSYREGTKHAVHVASSSTTPPAEPTVSEALQMEISYTEASRRVTNSLYNHVAWLVTDASPDVGDDGRVLINPKKHEQVLNLAQDLSHAVAGTPTPKHVGTALHVTKKTRSKEIVTLLNQFGNCISCQDAQRCITNMAEAVDQKTEEDGVFVPEDSLNSHSTTWSSTSTPRMAEHCMERRTLYSSTRMQKKYPHPQSLCLC